jgi:hypothetical protein
MPDDKPWPDPDGFENYHPAWQRGYRQAQRDARANVGALLPLRWVGDGPLSYLMLAGLCVSTVVEKNISIREYWVADSLLRAGNDWVVTATAETNLKSEIEARVRAAIAGGE